MKMDAEKPAITVARVKQLIGKEEFAKRTEEEWISWVNDLAIISDNMIEEITGSKYQSNIEKVERMLDNK